MSVLSNLRSARENLQEARDEASTGTSLMIRPIIEDINDLIERTETLTDEEG